MKTKAAILWEPKTEYVVDEIELDAPQNNEVLVEFKACGMCHSDEHLVTGDMALPTEVLDMFGWQQYPIICGHEGAGIVVEAGPTTSTLAVGDHVVTSFVPSCGKCPSCISGHSNLCDLGAGLLAGKQLDGTFRHHSKDGKDLALMCCLGAFAHHGVLSEASLVKIDPDVPLDKAALVACGVTTGWGSAVYAAEVKAGEVVVIVGIGGVGMSAVQGAAMAGAKYVIAVDPVEFKREQSQIFGATHSAASVEEAAALLGELTWGANANKVIVTTGEGHGSDLGGIMNLVAKGGRCVYTSVANMQANDVQLNLFDLAMQQKQLVGSIFGSANPRYDIPRLLSLYQAGKLKLDEMITKTYPLEEVNQGYQDMRDGKNIRGVLIYD